MNYLISYALILLSFASCSISSEKNEKVQDAKGDLGVTDTTREPSAKEVVCFVYHRFGDDRYASTNISVSDFESHLKWLAENDFQVLNLSEAIDYMKSDRPNKRTAVITIDDGYKSFSKNGLPLLAKYKMPATLFINTETVGSGDYMDWEQLQNAVSNKIEIGNHTHSHDYFLNQPPSARYKNFVNDIETSQRIIDQNLKLIPKTFAYPFGEFDEEMKTIVKAIGFKGAVAQNSGVVNSETDLYQIPRFPMSESYAKGFKEKALMKSLHMTKQSPTSGLISGRVEKPALTVTLSLRNIKMDQVQCFIQGTSCKLGIVNRTAKQVTMKLEPTSSISGRRRTLYTLTVPDSLGNWHWYSHLWVNPAIK